MKKRLLLVTVFFTSMAFATPIWRELFQTIQESRAEERERWREAAVRRKNEQMENERKRAELIHQEDLPVARKYRCPIKWVLLECYIEAMRAKL